jgi:hypothetical protein
VVRIWRIVSQQLCQRASPGLMQGGPQSGLDRLQIEPTVVVALLKNNPQEPVYFAGDFLLDRFGRFFSWADGRVSSTGRNSQICSLTSKS